MHTLNFLTLSLLLHTPFLALLTSWAPMLYPELAGNNLRVNSFKIESLDIIESDRLLMEDEGMGLADDLPADLRIFAHSTSAEAPFSFPMSLGRPYDKSFSFDLEQLKPDPDKHYYAFGKAQPSEPLYLRSVNIDHIVRTQAEPRSRMFHNLVLRQWPLYLMILLAGLIALKTHGLLDREAGKAAASADPGSALHKAERRTHES